MTTLFDLFDERPHFRSEKLAMSMRIGMRQERWTFAEYRGAVDSIAAQLLNEYALAPSDRVLICAPNSPRAALALHGIFRAGLVAVPLDAGATSSFIAKVAHDTEARALITVEMPREPWPFRLISLSALSTDAGSGPPNRPVAGDIAEIVYTSGTTGTPKGVVLTHGNLAANVLSIRSVVPSEEELRLLSILPLSHMLEQTVGLAMPLLLGGSVHYATSRHSPAIRRALKRHEITCMVLVPQVLDLIMGGIEREARNRGGWPSWDTLTRVGGHLPLRLRRMLFREVIDRLGGNLSFCICGGARLQPAHALAWETLGIRILEGYGATECAPVIASNTMDERRPGSVGRVLPGFEFRIDDAGEIQVRGESVFSGYWQNEAATRDAFTGDGWFRTGDLADQDAAGRLAIRGRLKDMIALANGMNVYCEDVERTLSEIAGIDECAVVGAPDAEGNARVHAVVCGDLPDEQIGEAVRTANAGLADHQRITAFSRWPHRSFPRTSLLKLKRAEILASLGAADMSSPGTRETLPADPLKALVAEISKVGADRIEDSSDLRLDLGFDSLMLVELAGVLEESLGVSIDEDLLAHIQTFGDLAKAVEAPPMLELPPAPPAWPRQKLARSLRGPIQKLLVFPALRLLVSDFRVHGAGHLGRIEGPCLLIANHSSHVDTLSILRALPEARRATTTIAAAADYFFRNRFLASLMALSLNLFPFSRRGNIRESLEFCGDLVDGGWSVLIYPEGTRSTTGELLDFKQGIGLLATGLKIPVVPIGVEGGHAILSKGQRFPRRGPVALNIGAPITVDPDCPADQVTRRLEDAVRSLMTPAAQPVRRQK